MMTEIAPMQIESAARQEIVDTIVRLGRAMDDKDWIGAQTCLADEIDTDYSSFRGTPAARLSAEVFLRLREAGLSSLVTHHLSLGHVVEPIGDGARCRCDFVIRRWPVDAGDARFFHSYGDYVYTLARAERGWRITGITQRVRRSEGDPSLHGALRRP